MDQGVFSSQEHSHESSSINMTCSIEQERESNNGDMFNTDLPSFMYVIRLHIALQHMYMNMVVDVKSLLAYSRGCELYINMNMY